MEGFFGGMGGNGGPNDKKRRSKEDQLRSLENTIVTGKEDPSDSDIDAYDSFQEYVDPNTRFDISRLPKDQQEEARRKAASDLDIIPSIKKTFRNAFGGQDVRDLDVSNPKEKALYMKLKQILRNKR